MRRLLRAIFAKAWVFVLRLRLKAARGGKTDRPSRDLYVFGDSLSDTGNVHRMVCWLRGATPTPAPYADGRFSNGPNWIDRLAAEVKLSAESAWQGGSNYAHGGAEAGFGLSALISFPIIPNIGEQIELFARSGDVLAATSWIVLYGGHNNVIAMTEGKGDCSWDAALGYLTQHLDRLYDLGGRKFLVPTLLPLDRMPDARGDADGVFSAWVGRFNRALPEKIDAFRRAHPDARVVSPDMGKLLNEILDDATAHGFADVEHACYDAGTGTLAGDPAAYFWWDGCHPTRRVQRYLAECAGQALRGEEFAAVGPALATARRLR